MNTVTLIDMTKSFIFGGFTPIACDSSNKSKFDKTQKRFFFTVNNAGNIESRKFTMSSGSKTRFAAIVTAVQGSDPTAAFLFLTVPPHTQMLALYL
jgi:hypothetical protein